jgi:hypothetical protein
MGTLDRRYVFLGLYRLDELYGQRVSRAESEGKRLSAFSFQAFGTGGGVQFIPLDKRVQLYREIERVLGFLKGSGQLGSLDEPRRYFHGRLSMYFVPFHDVRPPTLYMVGETERTFVALGGQVKDICNRDAEYARAEEGAPAIRSEPEVVRALARAKLDKGDSPVEEPASKLSGAVGWEADVIETHRRFGYCAHLFRKKDYEVLALKDEFTPREKAPEWMPEPKKGVLLGKPLFVAGD